jgi:serine/threonine protein kinase
VVSVDDELEERTRPLPVMGQPAAGAVLDGRYRLDRLIGQGGMADVWAGEDLFLDRPVAVKVFRYGTPGVAPDRIDAEVHTIAQLNHPGIVTMFDAGGPAGQGGNGDGTPGHGRYLVMELVDGQTLADCLMAGPLPVAEVVLLAGQLTNTLAYLHDRHVVHRDIKPANILLQAPLAGDAQPFQARLTDFGIARPAGSGPTATTGTTIGTATYLSPEQATGGTVGPATDVYALGLVLLETLTGETAYPGHGVEAMSARLDRPPHIPAGLGPHWAEVLAAMTAGDPARRPSAAELSREFEGWPRVGPSEPPPPMPPSGNGQASDASVAAAPEGPAAQLSPTRVLTTVIPGDQAVRRRRPRTALAVAGAVLAAVIVVVVLLVTMSPGRTGPSGPTPATTVHYPSVSGQIGEHLRQLEDAVG